MTASSSNRWQRLQALFYEALELKPDARAEFLQKNCAGDPELQKEIEGLLDSTEKPMDFLQRPILVAAQEMIAEKPLERISPGTQLAHYKIVSMLGAGGMGEVYLAEDLRLRRKVALKILPPDLTPNDRDVRRFEHEAQAASALNHPNILTVYEFGQVDGLRFIACEFIEGKTLRQMMGTSRLEPNVVVDVAIQIASALTAAHASGIVHRDIKPDNVIVRTDGIVKVFDFGIAKLTEARIEQTIRRRALAMAGATSEPGMVMGTAKYMSPEQARGVAVDSRSDIFSLGSVMYELITGRAAFDGETASDVIAEILKSDPPPPADFVPDVPYEIERIISKALRKDKETRYQSVKDLLDDLQNFKKEAEFQVRLQRPPKPMPARTGWGTPTPARPMPAPPLPERTHLSKKRYLPIAAVLIVIIVIGYFFVRKTTATTGSSRQRTLAILPLRNLKPDAETDFLGFSLADEIITKLGHVNTLTIRPSTSVDKYRNQIIDPKKVAAELDVDTLLTGSYIREGDDLRITSELIDVNANKILWREAMNVKYDKLLAVEDQVSEQIIKGLELNLSPAEEANIKSTKPINTAAYEDYLRGIDFYSLNQFAAAVDLLEKSTIIDPTYAPAWAHLGRAYTTRASLAFGGRDDYIKAQAAYRKAITLNPALVEPRIYMSNLLTDTGRVEEAVPLLRSVLQDNPNNAEAHWELGYAYRFAGMLKESVEECEKARQNNPQVKINSSAMNSYLYLGEYDKFLQSLPADDSVYILFYRGLGEYYMNNREQAATTFDRAFGQDPSLLPADVGKALSDSIRHNNAGGLKLLEDTENKAEERGVSDAESLYKLAQAFAVLGDKASALHMLRHSVGGGFFCHPYFVSDPLLQSLHNEPEFKALMKQAFDRHQQFKTTFF